MSRAHWIPLPLAAKEYGIPYASLYKYYCRMEARGGFKCMSYKHSLSIHSDELTKYLLQRRSRERSGDNERRRNQAHHANEIRIQKRKQVNNE